MASAWEGRGCTVPAPASLHPLSASGTIPGAPLTALAPRRFCVCVSLAANPRANRQPGEMTDSRPTPDQCSATTGSRRGGCQTREPGGLLTGLERDGRRADGERERTDGTGEKGRQVARWSLSHAPKQT